MITPTIMIAKRAADLDAKAWDPLVGSEVFATCGWLKTMEETVVQKLAPRYVMARHNGRLVGAAVCFYIAKNPDSQAVDEIMLGRLQPYAARTGISFLPALICCAFGASGAHIFVRERLGPEDRSVVCRSIVEAIEAEARRLGAAMAFPNVLEHERDLIGILQARGYAVTLSTPETFIENRWRSFDEYLACIGGMSRNMRKAVRREMNCNRKAGVTYRRLEDPNGYSAKIFELINGNCRKHERGRFAYRPEFFLKIKEHMEEDAVITLAEKAGQVIGALVSFRRMGVMHCAFIGVDHAASGNDCTYFNLFFYRSIQEAIDTKIKTLHFGAALYASKVRRGCRVFVPLYFYKPLRRFNHGPVKAWFRFHAAWYRRKLLRDLEPVRHYPDVALLPRLREIRQGSWGSAGEKEIPAQILSV